MYQFVILSAILAITSASPGNLGLGYGGVLSGGYSTGLGLGGYSGNQVTVASGSIAATPVVAAVPYVAAVSPVATSSQARLDLNGPTQVVTQIAAAVPVAQVRTIAAGGYGGYGGAAGAGGLGYGGSAGAGAGYGGAAGAAGAAGGLGGHGY